MKTILLLGSGELGREFTIACKRYGHHVVACDRYDNAPAMQVADESRVFDMLNASELDAIVSDVKPNLIVPEIEAIRTERLLQYEADGIHVVPSANAANMTMNRKAIRDLAAKELELKTANYRYATTLEDFQKGVQEVGIPCVVKPLMSSSGKGQSTIKTEDDVQRSWEYALEGSRGDLKEVIIEEFIPFESEITLLTVTQHDAPTLFCPPIGHRQERGDYQESWMPHPMKPELLKKAEDMAAKVTKALGGAGLWGVEFFITADDVYFSELSPRPHDTGMVTLSGCTNLSEFELHARTILGYAIPEITLRYPAASAVILASEESPLPPLVEGVGTALNAQNSEIRIFGKPSMREYRRMGVALSWGASNDTEIDGIRASAKKIADGVQLLRQD